MKIFKIIGGLAASLLLVSCAGSDTTSEQLGELDQTLLLSDGVTLWNGATSSNPTNLGAAAVVPVCWAVAPRLSGGKLTCSGATATTDCQGKPVSGLPALRVRVRDLIQRSWMSNANIEFIGWNDCAKDANGRHNDTLQAGKAVIQLQQLAATEGKICTTDSSCMTDGALATCVAQTGGGSRCSSNAIDWTDRLGMASNAPTVIQYNWPAINTGGNDFNVIHEFGHALGFDHEWLRQDWTVVNGSPDPCAGANSTGSYLGTGANDTASIMQYCAVGGRTPPRLSPWDIIGLQNAYGRKGSGSLVGDLGLCANVQGGSTANNTPIISYPCRSGWNDTFKRPAATRTHLETTANSRCVKKQSATGNPLISVDCASDTSQDFEFSGVEWRAMGDMCVHANGTFLELRVCDGTTAQKWDFFGGGAAGARSDNIRLNGTNSCVTTTTTTMGAQLRLAACNSSDTKQRFTYTGGGGVSVSSNTAFCMNISGGQPVTSGVVLWNGCSAPGYNARFHLHGKVKLVSGSCMTSAPLFSQMTMNTCTSALNQVFDYYL